MSSVLSSSWSLVAWVGLAIALVQLAVAHARLRSVPAGALGWTWRAIALVGFAVTWTFMLRMAIEDIARYPDLGAWARESNLFFDAYRRVTATPAAWWWSQQLMGWAMPGVLWFGVLGRRRGVRFWAYPWLAMCVAVSVALPLFALRLRKEKGAKEEHTAEHAGDGARGVPALTAAGIGLAALALAATPFVHGAAFVVAMLVLHAGLLAPAVATPRAEDPRRESVETPLAATTWAIALACLALHAVATARLVGASPRALLDVVLRDPAQSSITSDVLLT